MSKTGTPGEDIRSPSDPQTVEMIHCNPDTLFPASFPTPRHATGCFTLALKAIMEAVYGVSPEITQYGKPT